MCNSVVPAVIPDHWSSAVPLPGFAHDEALGKLAKTLHMGGQFAVYGLVVLHVAVTVWHVAVRRDGTLERMLPPQRD